MIPIHIDTTWLECFPGARMGVLEAHGLLPLPSHPKLEQARMDLETELRACYGSMNRKALRELPVMRAFEAHYKPHGRTYHVLQQLESVASKGRSIPSRICAVTALFMAELRHGLLAAGHDLAKIVAPLHLRSSLEGERYTNLGGSESVLPKGDMTLHHAPGLLSSVLFGPEQTTPISLETRDALYTIYAPMHTSAEVLEAQVDDLTKYLKHFSPQAVIEARIVPGL